MLCKISIIIPVYNVEKYLARCLHSVLKQTLEDIEIILINDGSNDDSLKICNEFKNKDSRIKVINKLNEGVSVARNVGIEEARGKYILFIDSDDWVDEKICEVLYENIERYNSDLSMCNIVLEENDKKINVKMNIDNYYLNKNQIKYEVILPLIENEQYNGYHEEASFRGPVARLFKHDILINNNVRFKKDLSIGEDFIFNIEYMKYIETLTISEEYMYHYRKYSESTMRKYNEKCWEIYKVLLINLENYLYENFNNNDYIERLNNLKMKYMLISIINEFRNGNKKNIIKKISTIKWICEDDLIKDILKFHSKNYIGINKYLLFCIKNKLYSLIVIYNELRRIKNIGRK